VSSTRPSFLLVCALLLCGCPRYQPVFVINHRDEPVQVVFRNETVYPPEQRTVQCQLKEQKPRVYRDTDVEEFEWSDAVEFASEYDESRCEIRLTLAPKSSAIIGANEFCSGATEYIGREGFRPRLNYLRVESAGGVVELSGWEVARNLVERRGVFSHGDCRFELR